MRFKKEQLYLLIFIVALVLAIVKTISIAGRTGVFETFLLLLAGIGLGFSAAGIGGAMRRELTRPLKPEPRREGGRARVTSRATPRERSAKRAKKRDEPARSAAPSGERKTGTVKWFNNAKGFGFISPDNGDKDCFVHRTAVDGAETLPEGSRVEYEVVRDDRGRWAAANVRAVGSS